MGGRVEAGGLYPVNELAGHGPGEILSSGGRQYLMARQDGYVQPMSASNAPRLAVNVVLPTPPFVLVTVNLIIRPRPWSRRHCRYRCR